VLFRQLLPLLLLLLGLRLWLQLLTQHSRHIISNKVGYL
jgi:hypothetical protein